VNPTRDKKPMVKKQIPIKKGSFNIICQAFNPLKNVGIHQTVFKNSENIQNKTILKQKITVRCSFVYPLNNGVFFS
jgi:hypothetical protein